MVASSPVLGPVFDRTVFKWLGMSVDGTKRSHSNLQAPPRTGAGATAWARGSEHILDSQEHLAWKLRDRVEHRTVVEGPVSVGRDLGYGDNDIHVLRETILEC